MFLLKQQVGKLDLCLEFATDRFKNAPDPIRLLNNKSLYMNHVV